MKKPIATILAAVIIGTSAQANPFGLWHNANTTNSYSDASKWIPVDGALPGGVPEPNAAALLIIGFAGLAAIRVYNKKRV